MNHYMQPRVRIQIRTILIVAGVSLAASSLYVVAVPQRAHALVLDTLRDTTRSIVKQLILPGGSQAPTQGVVSPAPIAQNTAPSSSTQTTTPATQPQASSNGTATADPAPISTEPLPLVASDLQKIHMTPRKSQAIFASTNVPGSRNSSSSALVFLQPTPEGWKVLGVLWYWWLIGLMVLSVIVAVWRRQVGKIRHYLAGKWSARRKTAYLTD